MSSLEKFWSYLIGTKVNVHTNYATLRFLMVKKDSNPRLIRWVQLLQELDFKVKDPKDTKNKVTYYLSHIEEGQFLN